MDKHINPFLFPYSTPHETAPFDRITMEDYEEAFMEGSIFDNLTISASASSLKTDLDIENYYMYLGTIQQSGWGDWNGLSIILGVFKL